MKQKQQKEHKQPWHRKPSFGSLYTMNGSKYIYISMNYFRQRLRFPTDRVDNPQNWHELCDFMAEVGEKIKYRTFRFAKTFYWLDDETKQHFTELEGGDFKPEPEHVLFGEYAQEWMERKIPKFTSITKQRDYREALTTRVIPYFGGMYFSQINESTVGEFIDSLKRINRAKKATATSKGKPLSAKRVKNIIHPMSKVWRTACAERNWQLPDPFATVPTKYTELEDRARETKERETLLREIQVIKKDSGRDVDEETETDPRRDIFLHAEWEKLLAVIDPHYHPVMELLLMGMIGSELEAIMTHHIKKDAIQVRYAVVRERGKVHLKLKPKNTYRSRDIPMTQRLRRMMDQAIAVPRKAVTIQFANGLSVPASQFALCMKDGSPFCYSSFRKTVWNKAISAAGLTMRVPYTARHTIVQWALLIGMVKTRLVDLMGHSTKQMVDEVYGAYRHGLVGEKQRILDYLGEDFLSLEELRTEFPERYRMRIALPDASLQTTKAPASTSAFCQSFSQSQGLYADNYAT